MAFIKKRRGNTTYIYEAEYESIENGKQKYRWKLIGKLDADGNVIPSKKKRASAETISAAFLNNSQNFLTSTNAGSLGTIGESNNGNDAIITASTNVNNSNNSVTTTTMPETSAMSSTATNNHIAATAATTVTDSVNNASDAPNIPVTSVMLNESAIPTMSTAKTTPVADEISFDASPYNTFAETPVEAPITAEISTPHLYDDYEIVDDNDVIINDTSKISPETEVQAISVSYTNSANPNTLDIKDAVRQGQDAGRLVAIIDVNQGSTEENLSQLPQVISQKADQFKVNMSKVENIAFTPSKNEVVYEATDINTVKVNVSRGKSPKKRVETLLYIDFNDAKVNGLNISHEDRLTPYDREVHNAVASLVAAGNICINPYMIFQVLSGNSSDKTKSGMSPETREKIVKSLNKMRFTNVKINASAEVKAGMILEGTIDSYLIPAKITEVMLNGQVIKDCICLYDTLPLFNYANMKNQIASVDVKMLDTPLANTPENIVLKCYVLKRILSISNEKNNMHDVIRYSTVYEYLGIQAPNKDLLNHKRKQIRDKIRKLLNYWKGEKLIKDYREEREGRTLAKVIIFVF